MSQTFMHLENEDWKHARRSAFVQDVLAAFTHRPAFRIRRGARWMAYTVAVRADAWWRVSLRTRGREE